MSASRARSILPLLPALVLAVLVFARATTFPFVNWDDPSHFLQNPLAVHPLARGWSGLFWTEEIGYPAPALQLSFALDMALFGARAGFWHAENVLLHLVNVALVFALSRKLRLTFREAGASAAIFAVHPLVVEPVCWVTGRKDVLSVALLLVACLAASGTGALVRSALARWAVANALAMIAVLIVPRMIVAAPFVALVAYAARPSRSPWRVAVAMAPAFAFAFAMVVLGLREVTRLGALPPPRSMGAVVADVAGVWALQVGHLVLPVDLLAYYFRVPGDPSWAAMVLAGAALAVAVWLAWSRTLLCSPERVGLLLALVAYAPASGLLTIRRWTADSYMYLPLVGIAIAIVPAVARRFPSRLARFGKLASYALLVVFAGWSLAYTSRWKSSVDVWRGGAERYPNEPLALEHEALALIADGRNDEADPLFIQIAERFPEWDDTFDDEVRAYESAGNRAAARAVLSRGVRAHSATCIRMYWMRVVYTPELLRPFDRDVMAIAFDDGFDAMKLGLRDRAAFERVVQALRAAGLDDSAARADEHVRRAFPGL